MAARALCEPVVSAVLTVLCGWILWSRPGEGWESASYDYLYRFGAPAPTNKLVLVLMDNASYDKFNISRGEPLAMRSRHAEMLEKLARAGCQLVVVDVRFKARSPEPTNDLRLAEAIRRQGHVILLANQEEPTFDRVDSDSLELPDELFCNAAAGWGVGVVEDAPDKIPRRLWNLPHSTNKICSLPWAAARLMDKQPAETSETRWLRYYSERGAWEELSYYLALEQPDSYFRDKIVFIGNDPETPVLDGEKDEFGMPYYRWNRVSTGGVKILATTFLNFVNRDWLRRPSWWAELLGLTVTGILLGVGFCRVGLCQRFAFGRRIGVVFGSALIAGLAVMFGAVLQCNITNYWFPWLVIAGGQVPFAFAWTVACAFAARPATDLALATTVVGPTECYPPLVHGYEYLTNKPFGEGAFGKVWVVRSVIGELNALKLVPQHLSGEQSWYGEIEFKGLQRYKPISSNHPGLLHILHIDVIRKANGTGYFYYVMELGDSLVPDWEKDPDTYVPCNLASLRWQAKGQRLPVEQCIEIFLPLTEALGFLHREGLTHRDIKPENIVFVRGRPKLADVGLVTPIRTAEETASRPGTPGYMPPPPEPVGTVAADIYALGMVLFVISTGRKPDFFPMIKTTLAEGLAHADFMLLNAVIVKATQPNPADRYASAAAMHSALVQVQAELAQRVPAARDAAPEKQP